MVFVGGKLSLKGDKKKKGKKKKSKSKHDKKKSSRDEEAAAAAAAAADDDDDEDEMTEAERKAQKYKQNAEKKDLEKVAKQSHRDRVEEYSQKLSELTELNDIPRVRSSRYMCTVHVLLRRIRICTCYGVLLYPGQNWPELI